MNDPHDHPIVPPLVIGEGWALDWFPSVRAAEGYFEPWFAHEDYVAFDSTGQRLRLDSGGYQERSILRILEIGGGGKFTVNSTGEHDPEGMGSSSSNGFAASGTSTIQALPPHRSTR